MRMIPWLVSPLFLLALPQGSHLAHGSAELQQTENRLMITATDKAIIDWDAFSIGVDETVQFIQPFSQAIAINRVLESTPSRLLGSIEANGQILLINPNGILVGKEATLDTQGIICSTLPFDETLFLEQGHFAFSGSSDAEIINEGKITAHEGDAFLIATHAGNWGTLESSGASAGLIASNNALIKLSGADRLFVRSREPLDPNNAYSMAFKPSEAIQAGRLVSPGGNLYVLGDHIDLRDGSEINASSSHFGGTVQIGGEWKGTGQTLPNAKRIYTAHTALISASVLEQGNGGRVVVWGDEANWFFGKIDVEGGRLGGDGGFVEVSSPNYLAYEGLSSTFAPFGKTGELLLDPLDISITTGVTTVVPTGACPGVGFTYTAGAGACISGCPAACAPGGSILNNATLTANLRTCNVTVTTVGSGLGCSGDILVFATIPDNPPVSDWNSNFSLTLRADRDITVRERIQNGPAGLGNVTLNAGRDILIGSGAAHINTNVSVGTLQGTTNVTATGNITLQTAGNGYTAQIGYLTVDGDVGRGPINVTCNTLNLTGGLSSGAQIGHGDCSGNPGNANSSTTAAATITVNATGNVNLATLNSGPVIATIGHGSRQYNPNDGVNSANQDGNIVVTSGIDVVLSHAAAGQGLARIGHGFLSREVQPDNFFPTMNGNITVRANRNIDLISRTATSNSCLIGHGGGQRFFCSGVTSDISVSCCGNLSLDAGPPNVTNQTLGIGAIYFNTFPLVAIPNVTQNISVQAAGSILMQGRQRTYIGCQFQTGSGSAVYTGDIAVIAGAGITMNTFSGEVFIGVGMQGTQVAGDFDNTNLFVATGSRPGVGGGISMTVFAPALPATFARIHAGGNVCVAAGDTTPNPTGLANITLNPNGLPGNSGDVYIGTYNLTNAIAPVPVSTRIFAAGNIVATNGTNGNGILGYSLEQTTTGSYNVAIRAGGDIQMATSINLNKRPNPGTILVEADSQFNAGEMWTYAGNTMTQVCGIPFNPFVTITNNCLPAPINATSPFYRADGFGGFVVNSLVPPAFGGNIILQTSGGTATTNAITVNSACTFANPNPIPTSITIGGAADNLQIVTTNGDITVAGSVCDDAFRTVTLNPGFTAAPYTGSILVRACDNVNVMTAVATTGPASTITMIADNDLSGIGNLEIFNNITTVNGNISLSAGLKDASCLPPGICTRFTSRSANINHRNGCIVSCTGTGNIIETASGSINLLNLNPTIRTVSGFINLLAGINININSSIVSLANGEIKLVAGRDINLQSATSLISSTNAVTLVCDNDFSSCPFNPDRSPIGKVTAVAGSQILGNPLLLFTALQSENSLLGTLNGSAFFPSTKLYNDTSTEVWCTVFTCPGFSNCSGSSFASGLGTPYTVFYKDCLQQATRQAMVIVDQFLVDLHPFNEYPGWVEQFFFEYKDLPLINLREPYYIRRRELHSLNHPKSWTALMNEGRPIK